MEKVSHRLFTKVKDSFDPSWISYYKRSAPMHREPSDSCNSLFWYMKTDEGHLNHLFAIVEEWDYEIQKPVKNYYVYPEAYRILRIIDMVRGTNNSNFSNSKDISW